MSSTRQTIHKKAQSDYYSKNFESYEEEVYTFDKARFQKVLSIVSKLNKGKMLEVGCSSGKFLSTLREMGFECYGMELSDAYLEALRQGLNVIQHNVEEGFPFNDNFFDIVVAMEVIEHLIDTKNFVKGIYKVLKPGGVAIITTPNLNSLLNRFLVLIGKYPRYVEYTIGGNTKGHVTIFNKAVLRNILEQNGLQIKEITGNFLSIPDPLPGKPIRNTILKKLGDIIPSLSENLIVVAEKR